MSGPASPDAPGDDVHLEASAYGQGVVQQAGRDLYVAGRDQHIHHGDGVRRVPQPGDGAGAVCPYPGLAPFTDEQAGWFFGRDRLTADLLGKLDAAVSGGGPVMVVAASGAGKSSLLQAGLLHRIAGGALPAEGSRDWPQVVIVPGEHPMRNAAAALAAALPATTEQCPPQDPGADDLNGLLLSLAQAAAVPGGPPARVMMVVDQFEELFTLCDSEARRAEFISWLWRASDSGRAGGPLAVAVCGLRADFYAHCVTGYAELRHSLQADQVVVGPMSDDELRQAIVFPAQAAGLQIQPGLADLLLSDLRASRDDHAPTGQGGTADYDTGRLPLLAHALRATWQQRHGSVLTVDGYRATGGIDHAIAETADHVYALLGAAEQREAKLIFLRLVKIGDAPSGDARRPVTRSDLATSAAAGAVLDAYISSRLLTSAQDAVQITHEALLSAWPKLKDWLQEDRAGHLTRQKVEDTAAEWEQHHRDASLLYRGASLETAVRWANIHYGDLTQAARDFLAASRRSVRRATLRRRSVISILLALVVGLAAVAFTAVRASQAAKHQRDVAVSTELAIRSETTGEADPRIARLLSLAAWRADPSSEAGYAMLDAATLPGTGIIPSRGGTVYAVAFSPDGKTVVSGGDDGAIRLWNPRTGKQTGRPLLGHEDFVESVAFNPTGTMLASGSDDRTIRLWNVATGQQIGNPLNNLDDWVDSVAFSPDGKTVVSGGYEGIIRLWNVATGQQIGSPLNGDTTEVYAVAFSPDGQTVVSGGNDGAIRLWNVRTGRLIGKPLTGNSSTVESVAFSPDGTMLASGGDDRAIRLWNVATAQQIGETLQGHTGTVESLAFSPDGTMLASGSDDETVRLWDPTSGRQLGSQFTGHTGSVESVAFSADGKTLASGSWDDTVRIWNVGAERSSAVLAGHALGVQAVAFSPDGKTLASGGRDRKIRLWDTRTGDAIGELTGHTGPVETLAFSPDGKILASGGGNADRTIRLWNVATRSPIGFPLRGGVESVYSVAFSPDGKTLATSVSSSVKLWDVAAESPVGSSFTGDRLVHSVAFSPDGKTVASGAEDATIRLWDVETGRLIGSPLVGHKGSIESVAFSPDGKTLASGSADGTIMLWDAATGRAIGSPLTGHAGVVYSVAFSPDGKVLASGSGDRTIRLWDVATGRPFGSPLTSHNRQVSSVAFSPDGKTLASGSNDKTIRLWDVAFLGDVTGRVCAGAGPTLTRAEWARWIPPTLPYQQLCPA